MSTDLLVKGKLIDMFDKNPMGGYLTNGNAIVGVMVRLVPGGRARRPSLVIQSSLFCLECGFASSKLQKFISDMTMVKHSHVLAILGSILNL